MESIYQREKANVDTSVVMVKLPVTFNKIVVKTTAVNGN